jgi:hypothetical protein
MTILVKIYIICRPPKIVVRAVDISLFTDPHSLHRYIRKPITYQPIYISLQIRQGDRYFLA